MTIHAGTQWEVRTTGNDTNGGGFSPTIASAGTDFSQQDTAQLTITDGVCTGNTTLTSATGGFTSAMIGNVVYMSSGPTWRTISAVTNTNTVTLAGNGPNASGMTCNVGGCLATPGCLSNLPVTGNRMWVKAGTYTITTATPGPSGPYYTSGSRFGLVLEGYNTIRGDMGARPVLNAGAITSVVLWRSANTTIFRCVEADGNSRAGIVGIQQDNTVLPTLVCVARNCVTGFNNARAVGCAAYNCTTQGYISSYAESCYAEGCGTSGFRNMDTFYCIAKASTTYGFLNDTGNQAVIGNVADGCLVGFQMTGLFAKCCIAVNNTTGFSCATGPGYLNNCASHNNTTDKSGSFPFDTNFQALALSPFVSSSDYTLTSAAATLLGSAAYADQSWVRYAGAVPPVASGGGSTLIVIED